MSMLEDQCARVLDNTVRRGDCLIWQGAVNEKGYGFVKIQGKKWLVHRLVALYHTARQPIQILALNKFRVYQACGLTICIEPTHLKFKSTKEHKEYVPLADWRKVWDESELKGLASASY